MLLTASARCSRLWAGHHRRSAVSCRTSSVLNGCIVWAGIQIHSAWWVVRHCLRPGFHPPALCMPKHAPDSCTIQCACPSSSCACQSIECCKHIQRRPLSVQACACADSTEHPERQGSTGQPHRPCACHEAKLAAQLLASLPHRPLCPTKAAAHSSRPGPYGVGAGSMSPRAQPAGHRMSAAFNTNVLFSW